ncbi:hypothetical protein N7478_008014 [Penicillium angulare]|uniref:uncharacterized protein n=1 Tax=Penicillium angulare TaxID=116970 RepID=UPI00253F7543|nr:uncharacterized protein N7478_008014 [Penicillium angulare]KAJ5272889.1 hypothetical protein N7478_008014 [Penicillium angulare]
MGSALNKGLVSGSVDASLDEIEAKSTTSLFPPGDITIGPFSVLSFSQSSSANLHGAPVGDPTERATDQFQRGIFSDSIHPYQTPLPPGEFPGLEDDLLQWTDIFGLNDNLFGITSNVSVASRSYHDNPASSQWLTSENEIYNTSFPIDLDSIQDISRVHEESVEHVTSVLHPQMAMASPTSTLDTIDILNHASFLLKTFQKDVVPQLTVVPLGIKTPWHIINIPCAILTLADLTVMESQDVTHARQANLFSLLSCSAMYLSVTQSFGYGDNISTISWPQIASQAYQEAKSHMGISLSEEIDGPNKAKYKDQLMAIFLGQHHDVRLWVMGAERILRLRGLVKSKTSHKARLLINVYSWLRIVGESTYLLHDFSPSKLFLDALSHQIRSCGPPRKLGSVPFTGRNIHLDEFLDLEHSDDDLNIDEPKDRNRDIPDIHLHDSRKSADTLSKQAYGLSETWLSLVSQTIRMANVLEKLHSAQDTDIQVDSKVWNFLHKRSNRLENVIHAYSTKNNHPDSSEWPTIPYNQILRAFNAALIILFYRRVRKVHPGILQGHVDSIINAFLAVHATSSEVEHTGPGTLWPIFLAGCEATTKDRREAILKLVELSKKGCGLSPVELAKNIMTEVWNRQDEHLKDNRREPFPAWMDVIKERKLWPLFC